MIEPRVYRAAFVPALLAVMLAMFSLESRPRPLPQGLAADVLFDGRQAASTADAIAAREPDRRAGTPGDRATATLVADTFADRGFTVERDAFRSQDRDLVNVSGRRPGRRREQVVVVAARDAPGSPDRASSAADTAALMELARVFEGRSSERTLVLTSVDGGRLGQAGARRLAGRLTASGEDVVAVLVMSGLGTPSAKPPLVSWSGDASRVGIGLERTAAESVRLELDTRVQGSSVAGQLSRLAFPLGVGAQGVFLDAGLDSLRFSGSGELTAGPGERLDPDRLGGLGRATLRTLSALDASGAPERGPRSYVTAVSQVLPGWVVSVLALALLAPAVVASVDAFARARRRREPVLPGMRRIGLVAAAFAGGLALAKLLTITGATPGVPQAAEDPSALPLDGPAAIVLGTVVVAVAGLLLALRRLVGEADDPTGVGAACAAALVLCGACLALWILDPYAALLAVPALHLWVLAMLLAPRPPRRVRVLALAGGLLPPVVVLLYYLIALSMNPLHGAWYLLM
ncbi:MAG: hypothetical protein M3375_05060, partial [Actinomycetota bacterium]|nr:hypothetical protein [Actinomycetota bacterium]